MLFGTGGFLGWVQNELEETRLLESGGSSAPLPSSCHILLRIGNLSPAYQFPYNYYLKLQHIYSYAQYFQSQRVRSREALVV